jgi:single-stranded-DNA-specific exonuclease
VALGTVADVVKLDANNRRLVAQGLKRIRAGRMQPGVAALFAVAGREPARASAFDFGFALGPRINAAGRLADMTLGIECLLTDDAGRAANWPRSSTPSTASAARSRPACASRPKHAGSRADARGQDAAAGGGAVRRGFHEGVVGIVAGRVKDRLHRPTFVFARGADGRLKGSGRSIPASTCATRWTWWPSATRPAAALRRPRDGRRLHAGRRPSFVPPSPPRCSRWRSEWLDAATLSARCAPTARWRRRVVQPETVALLDAQVWGQGFEAPVFCDEVQVLQQRLVGEKHLKLRLRHAGGACATPSGSAAPSRCRPRCGWPTG